MSPGAVLKRGTSVTTAIKLTTVILSAVLALEAATASTGAASDKQAFPVPRAEAELRRVIPIAIGFGAGGPVELDFYLALVGPYAPLDLQVTKAANSAEASLLRNFYLGVTARETGIEGIGELANAFHCGPCTARRRAFALEHLDAMKALVSLLAAEDKIHLVAQWGQQPASFRVNEMFKIGAWVREAIPSDSMGFVPSGRWNDYPDLASYCEAKGIRESSVMRLLNALEAVPAAAVVRSSDHETRVLLGGLSDNQAGVLFQSPEAPVPTVGSKLKDGTELRVIEVLEPGVVYYETT